MLDGLLLVAANGVRNLGKIARTLRRHDGRRRARENLPEHAGSDLAASPAAVAELGEAQGGVVGSAHREA